MRTLISLCALTVAATAAAAPVTLNHSGRLLDAAGAPLTGSYTLAFDLWDAPTAGVDIHHEVIQVLADDGFYAVTLGSTGNLDASAIGTTGLWLEVTVGTASLGRQPVGFVPLAAVADSVVGGIANVTDVQINGATVIDVNRDVTARDVAVRDITAASLSVNGIQVVSPTGALNTGNLFTRITATATIPGAQYSNGLNAGTWTGTAACPVGTQLVTWGTQASTQYWGSMTHWYANCTQDGANNGILASLYTQWGYGGHGLTCWGLCVKTP